MAEPNGHAARPHIHLHVAHQHHKHHDDGDHTPSSTGEQIPDHDSDVVYAGDDQFLSNGKVANVVRAEQTAASVISDKSSADAALRRLWVQPGSPPMLRPRCALYLQNLSIRC